MKSLRKILMLLTAFLLFAIADSKAQVFVSKIPVAPKYTQPKQPSKFHAWITDEWWPVKKKYLYEKGHWSVRPNKAVWKDGYWRKEAKGYVRVNGHWDYDALK